MARRYNASNIRRAHVPVGSALFHGEQPDQLQVEVVIGRGISAQLLLIERQIAHLAPAFQRSSQCAADVLAGPATENFIPEFLDIDSFRRRNFLSKHCPVSFLRNHLLFRCILRILCHKARENPMEHCSKRL